MSIVADLHLHSKYSRAVSKDMVLPTMAKMAKIKGIDLLATGDFTHPLWFKELESRLEETSEGIYKVKDGGQAEGMGRYILGTEISCIYSQGDKGRRIHLIVFAPNLETVKKINEKMRQAGCNLLSDGRPIIGLSAIQLCELLFSVNKDIAVIPAHCLLPTECILTNKGAIAIKDLKKGERVLTHTGKFRKIVKTLSRFYKGRMYHVRPWSFSLGLTTTPEHPFYAIKTVKKCRSTGDICRPVGEHIKYCQAKHYKTYKPEWILASQLEKGDVLLFPRTKQVEKRQFLDITEIIKPVKLVGNYVKLEGNRSRSVPRRIKVSEGFCRLVGYYLAEGYTSGRDDISFCFHKDEVDYLKDTKTLMRELFHIKHSRQYQRRNYKSIEIIFQSKILAQLFSKLFYQGRALRAYNKSLPFWMMFLPPKLQKEILVGWWLGDKGYTTSRQLMNQMKTISLRLGIVPCIGIDTSLAHRRRDNHNNFEERVVVSKHETYYFNHLSFFEDSYNLINRLGDKRFKAKLNRHHGWLDKDYVYLPIREIEEKRYTGKVYNLEVESDNSYVAEFAAVHNCWTPWFSLYGSKSGFDSIEECFGEFTERIYAVETGLSSSPLENWRIKELDSRAIVSFSDAHSPAKLGRELTVFSQQPTVNSQQPEKFSYSDFAGALKQDGEWGIAATVEFYPEEGKYHYTGHRNCHVVQSPQQTKKLGATCPVCGRPLTVGVMHRVEQLAGRELGEAEVVITTTKEGVRLLRWQNRPAYMMLVPLQEILAEVQGMGVASKGVQSEYERLIALVGSELQVLTKTPLEELERVAGPRLREAIAKVRRGDIFIDPGYDGVFGTVKIWGKEEKQAAQPQQESLF